MVRNILLLKEILLRSKLVAKLLLSNAWPTSMVFPKSRAVIGMLVTELSRAPSYKFFLLTATQYCQERISWLTSNEFTSLQKGFLYQSSEACFNFL